MSSLISNILVGVGKQVWNAITDDNETSISSRSQQLQQFKERLDFAVNPEKAGFNNFLKSNYVDSMEGVEFLSEKVKDGLLSDPELSEFVSQNGGFDGDFSIGKNGSNYVLTSSSGDEWIVQANTELETRVGQLYRLESIRQLAATQPGLSLDHLVDFVFKESTSSAGL